MPPRPPQRLTEVCRLNGGVYVKAGQFSGAFNSVPNEYRKHLALLQDKAKPRPFATVNRVLRCELGASAEEVFAEFSAEATAAASLAQARFFLVDGQGGECLSRERSCRSCADTGPQPQPLANLTLTTAPPPPPTETVEFQQVHKARLHDGSEVAVKIQYPGLRGAAGADLSTLSLLSDIAVAAFPDFNLGWLYKELRHKLEEELGEGLWGGGGAGRAAELLMGALGGRRCERERERDTGRDCKHD